MLHNIAFTKGVVVSTKKIAKKLGVDMVEHVHQVEAVIDRYLDYGPHSCLRLGEKQTLFLLLTLGGDPKWCYQVNEPDPRVRVLHD